MPENKLFAFDQRTEEKLFNKATPQILHDGVQFEGLLLTQLQTEQIANNELVSGVRPSDLIIVHDMHKGAKFVAENYHAFGFDELKALHALIGRDDAPFPGKLRTSEGRVNTPKGDFIPPRINPSEEAKHFNGLLNSTEMAPETKAVELFTYLSRTQLFGDTNKRTAVLVANVPLLQAGAGVFYIPETIMENTMSLMSDYYWSNDNRLVNAVLKEVAISDYDGKSFYDEAHQEYEYADKYRKRLNLFKAMGPKGLLGKEKYNELTGNHPVKKPKKTAKENWWNS